MVRAVMLAMTVGWLAAGCDVAGPMMEGEGDAGTDGKASEPDTAPALKMDTAPQSPDTRAPDTQQPDTQTQAPDTGGETVPLCGAQVSATACGRRGEQVGDWVPMWKGNRECARCTNQGTGQAQIGCAVERLPDEYTGQARDPILCVASCDAECAYR